MSRISYFTLAAVMLCGSLVASEDGPKDGDHIKPGTRPLAHTEWLKVQTEREEQEKLAQERQSSEEPEDVTVNVLQEKLSEGIQGGLKFEGPKAGVHYTSHPGAFHNPVAVSALGDTVEFRDGSIWTIASGDTYKTLNWLTSDRLVVTPNHSWFSSFMFCITNQDTGVSVKANLFLGPIYNGLYTHWIVAINYYTQEICLEDGSIWKLSGFDSSIYNKWLLNDTIIIGVNDGFLSSSKPNILINVNTLTYSRAKCTF